MSGGDGADAAGVTRRLLDRHGTTYAEEAGITLADEPAPLWQLLVLTLLLSARISSTIAVAAARELFAAGCTTAAGTRDTRRQQRIAALGRGRYRRYDERTATQLGDLAAAVLSDYGGDLRRMHERSDDPERDVQRFKGIGPAGAAIFCREVQAVWRDLAPYVDGLVLEGARRVGLPATPDRLAALVSPQDLPRLAAGCVRAARSRTVAEDVIQRV